MNLTRHGFARGERQAAVAMSMPKRLTRAYRRAKQVWGSNASAIRDEVVAEVAPDLPYHPQTGVEHERLRRIERSIAARQAKEGVSSSGRRR